MDSQLGTRDGSSSRPSALLEIFFFHTNSSTPLLNIYIVFVTEEDDIARFDSRQYTYIAYFYFLKFVNVLFFCNFEKNY